MGSPGNAARVRVSVFSLLLAMVCVRDRCDIRLSMFSMAQNWQHAELLHSLDQPAFARVPSNVGWCRLDIPRAYQGSYGLCLYHRQFGHDACGFLVCRTDQHPASEKIGWLHPTFLIDRL